MTRFKNWLTLVYEWLTRVEPVYATAISDKDRSLRGKARRQARRQ